MKIAIFHNFLDNIGGAEIVTLTLAKKLNADIYTTNIDKLKITKMGFSDILPRIKSIGSLPKKAPLRQQLALFKFRHLNLKKQYDFYIISGDWAMSGAVNNHPNLWYVHSPLNELWEFTDFISKNILNFWKRPIYKFWVKYNRQLTTKYSQYVDNWVCNSKNTQTRIKKYYQKKAKIIFPPVDITKFKYQDDKQYWLSVNRLVMHKRIEIQIKAFAQMPDKKLIILGSYEKGVSQFENYKKKLEKNLPNNIKIKHWLDEKDLINLYANCTGLVTTSKNEDFGMNAIEAMSSGKPVIAPDEGGYQESIINDQTGFLIKDINYQKIITKVKEIEKNLQKDKLFYKLKCQTKAKQYSQEIFINNIKAVMNKKNETKKITSEIWGITSFFNPQRYKNKINNYRIFKKNIKNQGLKLITVECALQDKPFQLKQKDADILIQVRSNSTLWHKERLLNIALKNLPENCDKIIWLDADILFLDNNWVNKITKFLENYDLVKPFTKAIRLNECNTEYIKKYGIKKIKKFKKLDTAYKHNTNGHPFFRYKAVFAWAAKKNIFDNIGFYDKMILGGADSVMSSILTNDIMYLENLSPKLYQDIEKWKNQILRNKKELKIKFMPGTIFHLFHGTEKNRKYYQRYYILKNNNFDPTKDLELNKDDCWEITKDKKKLIKDIKKYFYLRNESNFSLINIYILIKDTYTFLKNFNIKIDYQKFIDYLIDYLDNRIGAVGIIIKKINPKLYKFLKKNNR